MKVHSVKELKDGSLEFQVELTKKEYERIFQDWVTQRLEDLVNTPQKKSKPKKPL